MDKLIEVLESVKPGIDFRTTTNLIEDEILDSFDIVTLVAKINEEFDVDFPVSMVVPEVFNTKEALLSAIESLD